MKPLALLEDVIKKPVFGCRTCGQCVLHSTGMTCPMTCPKTLRNGPCGGVREDGHCEVKPEMRCVWVTAVDRAEHLPLLPAKWRHEIDDLRPPVDNRLRGHLVLAEPGDRSRSADARRVERAVSFRDQDRTARVRRHGRDAGDRRRRHGGGDAPARLHGGVPGRGQRHRQRGRPRPRFAARGGARDPALRGRADHAARLPRPEPAGARGRSRRRVAARRSRTSGA